VGSNHDLDILVERRQQVHQAFDGEALQLVATKRRNPSLFWVIRQAAYR
jgi:hypothetical protein